MNITHQENTILVVDDTRTNLQVLSDLLSQQVAKSDDFIHSVRK